MKIKIVRQPGYFFSGHLYLYAWSDKEEDHYEKDGVKVYAIRFNFYDRKGSSISADEPDSYDEDHNSVILYSDKSFNEFCARLGGSEFSDGHSFDPINMNCVDSIKFALELADININFDERRGCKHIIGFFCCPSTMTTPREFITTLKNDRNKIFDDKINAGTSLLEDVMIIGDDDEDDQKKQTQLQRIRDLEDDAIRDEKFGMCCLLATMPWVLGGISGAVITAISLGTFVPAFASPVVVLGGVGASIGAGRFFYNRANSKSDEIKKGYQEMYSDSVRAFSVTRLSQ